ncbi:MAG: ABC transporter substrate-binding protein [Pseudobutyrivibrio sp.]|nr:ABC transporter substrate-binding protein [Pseudobutyrivibrio sp.]
MKKRIVAGMMAAMMMVGAVGCGSTGGKENSSDAEYTIGIAQFAEHGSLDNCREGFLEGLKEEGIVEGENLEVLYDNAQTDTGTASTIADNYVSKKVDMICAIATPCAMSAYNSAMNTEIPVVYTAISDPVAAQLADKDGNSVGNITGTSDALPVKEQLEMIRALMPEAKKIGIIYTTSETNSVSTIATYKEYAADYGFEIVDTGINTIADVDMAVADMVSKVDCITNLTDNTVVSGLQTVLEHANKANIPVFGSEVEQVKVGCLAAAGIDYKKLGIQTGKMAAKILKGEAKASEIPFEKITEPSYYANTAVAENLGITLPDDFTEKAEVFDAITVSEE